MAYFPFYIDIENKKILDEVLLTNNLIEEYAKKKNIHFQNDW